MTPDASIDDVREFWDSHPCNSTLSQETDRRRYFDEITQARYEAERHIPHVGAFAEHRNRDVLEIGCGIATDGLQFALAGARYIGVDLTPTAIAAARERFELYGAEGELLVADGRSLPVADASIDHVYCFGVLMHTPEPERVVAEIQRVLRPGGTVCAMVYNQRSVNYYVEIMLLRRLMRPLLYARFMPKLLSRITGLDRAKLEGHAASLRRRRRMTRREWLTANTDGPDCPRSDVYTRSRARELFGAFEEVSTDVYFFDRRHWPVVGRLLPRGLEEWLGARVGWHLIVRARVAAGA